MLVRNVDILIMEQRSTGTVMDWRPWAPAGKGAMPLKVEKWVLSMVIFLRDLDADSNFTFSYLRRTQDRVLRRLESGYSLSPVRTLIKPTRIPWKNDTFIKVVAPVLGSRHSPHEQN